MPILASVTYLALCIALHVWGLTQRWDDPKKVIDGAGFQVLFVFQRTGAVIYYYFYKRTALRLADPRFYEDSEWIIREFEKKQ